MKITRFFALFLLLLTAGLLPGCPDSNRGSGYIFLDGIAPPKPQDVLGDGKTDVVEPPLPCAEDKDCPEGLVCDPTQNICVECWENADCPEGQVCRNRQCQEVPRCSEDKKCPQGLICDLDKGLCVECLTEEDCEAGMLCEEGLCKEPPPPCELDGDCPNGMICHPELKYCVYCWDDSICPTEDWCDPRNWTCRPDVCQPGEGACVAAGRLECRENGSGWGDPVPCPEGTMCLGGICRESDTCIPGTVHCLDENTLRTCDTDGTTWSLEDCEPGEICYENVPGAAVCATVCLPECFYVKANSCGPDGCGGICDQCEIGFVCEEGADDLPFGESAPCLPDCSCADRECGFNECGEFCGDCPSGTYCDLGQCIGQGYTCGDTLKCIEECVDQQLLPTFAECGDYCAANTSGEAQEYLLMLFQCIFSVCPTPVSQTCYDNAISGTCSDQHQACVDCHPVCVDKDCGDDGCGGSCGECPYPQSCVSGECMGTGTCTDILDCVMISAQPIDAAIQMCLGMGTPSAQSVFLDMVACAQPICPGPVLRECLVPDTLADICPAQFEKCQDCNPECTGRECGPDGCGGMCGLCMNGWFCEEGLCQCIPDCLNNECGQDGCGGSCGICPLGFTCSQGQCTCLPDCMGRECGSDGCSGQCGYCLPGENCTTNGSCLSAVCPPGEMDCDGNTLIMCAEDGNGWYDLGECPAGTFCQKGECTPWLCEPSSTKCQGNSVLTCSGNGQGWLAPVACPFDTFCQAGECLPQTGCEGVPEVGCCDGNLLKYCTGNQIKAVSCGLAGCGWMEQGYDCGGYGADPSGQWPLECPGVCTPSCDGKACGHDGCGGTCGICPLGSTCEEGQCIDVCIPQCSGKSCGPDGCNGVCGVCAPDNVCVDNTCLKNVSCGDLISCTIDCWPISGSSCVETCTEGKVVPESYTNLVNCAAAGCDDPTNPDCFKDAMTTQCQALWNKCVDCVPACSGIECGPDGCGGLCGSCDQDNQVCQNGKCQEVCVPSCQGAECGSNGCGGVCGVCGPGEECINGQCTTSCVANCAGKECGSDGCGGSCGYCLEPLVCNSFGKCDFFLTCGDGFCDLAAGESCLSCPGDCGPCTTGCDPSPWPGCGGCACEECVCQMAPHCCDAKWDDLCAELCWECGGCGCLPQCTGKQCGPDACGGSCGTCPAGNECISGSCTPVCTPDCEGKECGSNECGGTCGTCPQPQTCKNNQCFEGLSCGSLVNCSLECVSSQGAECLFGCMEQGTPEAQTEFYSLVQCVLFACGFNITANCMMNSLTGACSDEYYDCIHCDANCTNKQCGPDGCGGSCGTCQNGTYCDNYKCKAECYPNCTNKECGTDGCGGSCGTCPTNEQCSQGACVPICVPNCQGKQCGSDGCGGTCGFCADGYECNISGKCEPVGPLCGDGLCDYWLNESCETCPWDCGECGNGCVETMYPGCGGCVCEACVCEMDPFCCSSNWDWLCVNECYDCGGCGCVPSCQGKECGPDGCGGSCGICDSDQICQNGVCVGTCQPSCVAKQCGPDGCGGTCGTCPEGFYCGSGGACQPSCVPDCQGIECGPDGCNGLCGLCGPDEACLSGTCVIAWDCMQLLDCLWDCPDNDDTCWDPCWTNASPDAKAQYIAIWDCIVEVCGDNPSDACTSQAITTGECQDEFDSCMDCTPACTGKQCGDDGCGGSCGTCPTSFECDPYGFCDCIPSCTGKDCGSDGCGSSCGECGSGFLCSSTGHCTCLPQCQGKECGSNGCGGSCGTCDQGFTCSQGQCVENCVPSCNGKECGPDGCGGICGSCPPGLSCNLQGFCQMIGPVCGDGICDMSDYDLGGESCLTCPMDCGQCFGDCCEPNGTPGCDDSKITECVCAMDSYCCTVEWDETCAMEVEEMGCGQCGTCEPDCNGRECGTDGCGGSCGGCSIGLQCIDGDCVNPYSCQGHCGGFAPGGCRCGDCLATGDCCPDVCTACPTVEGCTVCTPNCTGKQCGPDGCGGTCGQCGAGQYCSSTFQCKAICTPNCTGKTCGPDGCGGTCGTCLVGNQCNSQGQCICSPNCTGKDCGSDGCGGSCGTCEFYEQCSSTGKCSIVTPLCGDGNCMAWLQENCDSCPQDCGACCGNGTCQAQFQENCYSCTQDCGACCGNGFCEAQYGETCTSCTQDCGPCPVICGDGKCDEAGGESCYSCTYDCGACPPVCGDGECEGEETCSNCPSDCGTCPVICGDGKCESTRGETCANCSADCGPCPVTCGDGLCDPNESCSTCAEDCGPCFYEGPCCEAHDTPGCEQPEVSDCVCKANPICCDLAWFDECVLMVEDMGCGQCCTPQCWNEDGTTRECGSDGCGGTCGQCAEGETCNNQGQCTSTTQTYSCADILGCSAGCGSDMACVLSCSSQGSSQAQTEFASLLSCAMQVCGFNFDMNCAQQAFITTCNQQFMECIQP